MPPQELDQDAVRLAKAIRHTESRDREDAKGASGEFGLYQWMPDTWASTTKKYGLDANDRSRANQNKAAYLQIKELKDKGYKPSQIAAFWNSGKTEGWEDMRGTNKYGVQYDVPGYVSKVGSVYESLKTSDVPREVTTKSTAPNVKQQDNRPIVDKIINNPITRGIQTIFPGKRIGQAIGTLAGYVAAPKELKETYDVKGPTPLQVAGDVAQAGLMVGAGVPGAAPVKAFGQVAPAIKAGSTAAARIAQAAGVGAGFGASSALAEGDTSLKEIGTSAATGAVVGGVVGGGAEAISAIAKNLPKWFVQSHIPKIDSKTAEYAVQTKKLGSPQKMYLQSETELNRVGQELADVIKNPKGTYVQPNGNEILTTVANSFDNAGMSIDDIAEQLKKIAPLHKRLVDKLVTGQNMTIDELWTLNKAIGPKVFKGTPFDAPEVRAGKEVANVAWHAIERVIKESVPESVPLFERYAQERTLNAALEKLVEKMQTKPFLKPSLYDILFFIGGHTAGGPLGGAAAFGAQRALTSPTANLSTAGLISRLPTTGAESSVYGPLKGLITRGALNATQ